MNHKEENNKIPFGAKDSELVEATYFIPEGMEAVIEGDKVIIRRKESEDEKVRKELIKHLKEGAEGYEPAGGSSDYQRWLAWLEKQGEQKPAEWSEEDEERLGSCIFCTQALAVENHVDSDNTAWLKSIKDRVQPQNRWKPSAEQLNVLHDVAIYIDHTMFPCKKGFLMKLYKQLKKL